MKPKQGVCPDCAGGGFELNRRDFIKTVSVSAATAAGASLPLFATPRAEAAPSPKSVAETAVKGLYDSLTDEQRKKICYDWDYKERKRGLLRTFVSNNWQITPYHIKGDFYTQKQQQIIHDIFKGIINPDWYKKFLRQLKDDTGGQEWGKQQSIAIFGKPGGKQFEFVMTGRHMTIRADGNTEPHVAFGGPIFYGHAASGFTEKPNHPGNVFWHQGVMANKIYQTLTEKQQKEALLAKSPAESDVGFRKAKAKFPGIPIKELSKEQEKAVQKVLLALVEPYRKEDREEALECLKKQGGLDKCSLSFYKDQTLTKGVWDNWRLEGPSFVWYFRGYPHVHVWVNVADDSSVKLNARG
jgi:hypothetical protein